MKKLIRSTKVLQHAINRCINDLVDARMKRNLVEEQRVFDRMESLMVSSSQQLQCIMDVLVPLSRKRKSEEGCLVLSKESRDALLKQMKSTKRGPCVKVEQPLQEKIEEMVEYFRDIESKQVDLGKDERGLMYGMLTYKKENQNDGRKKKVFVVTAGEGVGKFVVGLFESREAAEEYRVRSVKTGPSGVVELEFNTPKSDGELKMLALEVNVGKEPDGPSNNKDCMFSGLSDKIQVVATIKNDPPKSESPKLPWYVGDDFCQ